MYAIKSVQANLKQINIPERLPECSRMKVTSSPISKGDHSSRMLASVAQLDAHPTGDQEVVGLTPTRLATLFRGDLIMKYFLQSFSSFC